MTYDEFSDKYIVRLDNSFQMRYNQNRKLILKGAVTMPNIVPISDLRNYSAVLQDVAVGSPVYLTKNGRGCYAIVDIEEQEEYERTKAALRLMCELEEGRKSGEKEGWISSEDIRKRFGAKKV